MACWDIPEFSEDFQLKIIQLSAVPAVRFAAGFFRQGVQDPMHVDDDTSSEEDEAWPLHGQHEPLVRPIYRYFGR